MRDIGQWAVSAACALVILACSGGVGPAEHERPPWGVALGPNDTVVVVAAGDIVCGAETPPTFACHHQSTADLVRTIDPHIVLGLGDLQYEEGSLEDFRRFYDPSWGSFKAITFPAVGNHEYETPGAQGYFDYFDGVGADSGRAGRRGAGYYAVRIGSWLLIALNSNCSHVSCDPGSPQEQWLRDVLADSMSRCTLAFMHHPRFSSANRSEPQVSPLWQDLDAAGTDVVLAAHGHHYERLASLTADGRIDSLQGIRSFVVGTGGKSSYRFADRHPASRLVLGGVFGVIRLQLWNGGYQWEFVAESSGTVLDRGRSSCH
ncbi:MAG TPA: metallophosphoesterase [Gemmatimonadaceae bacterium]